MDSRWLHPFSAESEDDVLTSAGSLSIEELCMRVKEFGYAATKKIRIYGEDFEVLSDPFPSGGGIAIHVWSGRTSQRRILQLPTTVIHRARPMAARDAGIAA